MSDDPTPQPPAARKAARVRELAKTRYVLRRATRWPYAMHGEHAYKFEGSDRRMLLADLRAAWREKYPDEEPPADRTLSQVVDDLRHAALETEPDAPGADDLAEAILGEAGIGPTPLDRGVDLVSRLADCPLPPGYVIPAPYLVSDDGIHLLREDGASARVAWAWLFPVAVFVDPAGDQWVELVWRDHGRWISRLVRRSVAKSGRRLITEVGDAALPITDSEARAAEKWIAAAESANRSAIVRHPVARQLGWQADGKTFVTAADSPWRIEPRYADQVPALAAHHPEGTLAGWHQAIAHAGPYLVVQAGVYAGLAPALLDIVGVDSFAVDVATKSSRGKTITAGAGLSCWADPAEKGDGLLSWQTTVIAAEKRLNLVCGLPVVIDETRLVKDPAIVDTVLYMLPKNHGKPRGGGWPNMIPWRTIAISTGEQPATSFTTHQGASARVLSIQRAPFGTEGDASRIAAEALKHGIEANYGVAGPAFVMRLQEILTEPGGRDRLRQRHADITVQLRGTTDMTGRRAPLIAVVALAAELAYEWGITPWEPPAPEEWLALFAADEERDNRPEMALDIVREYISGHASKLWGRVSASGDERPPASGWIGRDVDGGVALLPELVREELRRRGYELDAVLPGWRERGILVERPGQEPPWKIPVRIAGRPVKCIVISTAHLEDAGAGEDGAEG